MPIDTRDYYRGEHPPACTCADCVQRRLETGYFRYTRRPKRRNWVKVFLFAATPILLVSAGILIALSSDVGKEFWGNISDAGNNITEDTSERGSESVSDVSSTEQVNVGPVETDCRTTPAVRDSGGEYVHEPIDVIKADTTVTGNLVQVSGRIIDRCKEIWSLNNPSDYIVFAVYRYPEPSCSSFTSCPPEEPIGGVLEPLSDGWSYTNLDAGDVIANDWTVLDDSFEIEFKPVSLWGETFRFGVWGWDVENRRPGHLVELVIPTG